MHQPEIGEALTVAVVDPPAAAPRRRIGFRLAALVLSLSAAIAAVLAIDVSLHARYAPWLGYNVWGYRGRALGRKLPGEYRVAVLGGSVAYGYAVAPTDTIEVFLERALRAAAGSDRFTVVNLAYNAQGAYAFAPTLRDYRYLQCDLAILFEGYNDLRDDPQNLLVFRRASPVFRLTGYLPIFPMVFREKAAALMHGGDVSALYESSGRRVFRPTWAARTEAGALRTAASLEALVERQLDRIDRPPSRPEQVRGANMCAAAPAYCRSIAAAIDEARSAGMQVLVATQPYVIGATRTAHVEQQQEMADMLARRYGTDRAVQYVNLGDALDLSDPALSGDAMHPTAIGNARLAAAFTRPVLAMAAAR